MSGSEMVSTETTRGNGDSFSKRESWDITDPPEERGPWGDKLAAVLAEIMKISPGGFALKFSREEEREGVGQVEIYEATFDSLHRVGGEGGSGMKSRVCFEVASTNILASLEFGLERWRQSTKELAEKGYETVLRPPNFAELMAVEEVKRAAKANRSRAVLGALQKVIECYSDHARMPKTLDEAIAEVGRNPDLDAEAKDEVLGVLGIMKNIWPEMKAEEPPAPVEANG